MPTETPAATWLDIMPAMPLAPNVPVVTPHSNVRGVYISADERYECVCWPDDGRVRNYPVSGYPRGSVPEVRVDLDDPQGFGYALQWFSTNHVADTMPEPVRTALADATVRWLMGHTCDEDRCGLAAFIAEAVR